jgi:hypothetical protein
MQLDLRHLCMVGCFASPQSEIHLHVIERGTYPTSLLLHSVTVVCLSLSLYELNSCLSKTSQASNYSTQFLQSR